LPLVSGQPTLKVLLSSKRAPRLSDVGARMAIGLHALNLDGKDRLSDLFRQNAIVRNC
jgi:hypothetical protein